MKVPSFKEQVVLPLDAEDKEVGCFLAFKINGLMIKLVRCKKECELINVYAADSEGHTFQFNYEYETGDTKPRMVKKITQRLVNLQADLYLKQKEFLRAGGRCVKH